MFTEFFASRTWSSVRCSKDLSLRKQTDREERIRQLTVGVAWGRLKRATQDSVDLILCKTQNMVDSFLVIREAIGVKVIRLFKLKLDYCEQSIAWTIDLFYIDPPL